jgi:hypothetical protein
MTEEAKPISLDAQRNVGLEWSTAPGEEDRIARLLDEPFRPRSERKWWRSEKPCGRCGKHHMLSDSTEAERLQDVIAPAVDNLAAKADAMAFEQVYKDLTK